MSNNDLNTFFRLLDANPHLLARERSGQAQAHHPASPQRRAFSPNFDVQETEKEYVLEGELPGLADKSKVSIEFTESQTLLVRGRLDRSADSASASSSHKPTVEDAEDEADKAVGGKKKEDVAKETRPKYWVSERVVGEFERSFSFPGSIDVDRVSAKLEHGILRIVVPKREKPLGRKIAIQ